MRVWSFRRIIKVIVIILITFEVASGQNETDNWYFGNKAALNFSTCNPTIVFGSQVNTIEGCATISSPSGNLLFYTDGIKVWRKDNALMLNGSGLYGHPSSSQSGVIVPQPGNDSMYYIFTIDVEDDNKGLCYSIVNMKLDGGFGAVTSKNVVLYQPVFTSVNEKIAAIRHGNKKDIWVVTREYLSDKYFAWLVTENGVSSAPIISTTPYYIGNPYANSRGYLKPSADGKLLVAASEGTGFWEISRFNDMTGEISNTKRLQNRPHIIPRQAVATSYGVEFSPNSKLLYIGANLNFTSTCTGCLNSNAYIYQYNVAQLDSAAIENSVVIIDSCATVASPGYQILGAFQLAKNGKIYFCQLNKNKLNVINNPNVSGLACNLQFDAISLGSGIAMGGLPTFIQSYFDPHFRNYDYSFTEDCSKTLSFTFSTTYVYDSLRWNFDDPASGNNNTSTIQNPSHTYNSNGPRQVKLFIYSHDGCINIVDTVKHDIVVGNKYFNLGKDTSICESDTLLLNATVTGALSYTWSTGAGTSTIKAYQPIVYWCDVNFNGCVYRDSLTLGITTYPIINLGKDTTLCEEKTLTLDAATPTSTYQWQDGSVNPTYLVSQKGRYFVAVNKQGCISKDTIDVEYTFKPQFTLGPDKSICLGNTVILDPGVTHATYLWQDGSTTQVYRATQQGTYRVTVTNICGSTTDDLTITQGVCELYVPGAFSPNGDGLNDIFKPGFGDNVTTYHMQVFNRYGQLIFESRDKSTGWNGTYKQVPQDSGAYIWQIRYTTSTNKNVQVLRGTVVLVQ
jgi:gliding motility-associated-like protein